jgi:plasmid rolling circle replication initiator protein Rep
MGRLIVVFKCKCGSDKCYREPAMVDLTFYEGHFHCLKCNQEYDYSDEELQLIEVAVQLTLF